MKNKDQQGKIGKAGKEASKIKKELAKIESEALKKRREESKMEMEGLKKDALFEKNRIALERLQLNWVKWNITCIALGFTAYKFYYARTHDEKNPVGYVITGRELGIFLVVLGLMTLILATVQHRKSLEKLRAQVENLPYSLSLRLSYVVMGFSVVALLLIIFRG